jgi:hypothetical protein
MSELTVQRAHTVAHLAFQQWKLAQIHRAMLKRESELLEQRDKLMGLLQVRVVGVWISNGGKI